MIRLKAIIKKEFIHIRRDPRSLVIIFVLPLVMIFIFGHVLSFDLKKIETLIIDLDRSLFSRELASRFASAPLYSIYFLDRPSISRKQIFKDESIIREKTGERGAEVAEKWLRQGKIKQYLVIPPDFSRKLSSNQPAQVAVVIDGSDANVANRIYQYNERIFRHFFFRASRLRPAFEPEIKMFFNPEIASTPFIIPGLVAALMLMISAMLTSLSLTREKETGSIDLLFISPLRSQEIIIGKTIPYLIVALLVSLGIILFARFLFHVQIRGSLLLLFLSSLIYLIVGLSLGILISVVASSQKVAMLIALLGTILPSIFLSGFIFPLESLSPILRAFSYFIPATYFLRILRGIVLKGASLPHFLFEALILVLMSFFLLGAASRKFQSLRRAKT
ncbi:MAG: ABC transporter permease [Candidatus Aminicenantes bacterium]|nr:ABC transporter permease [Candidatus Aminicenantes bacterium]